VTRLLKLELRKQNLSTLWYCHFVSSLSYRSKEWGRCVQLLKALPSLEWVCPRSVFGPVNPWKNILETKTRVLAISFRSCWLFWRRNYWMRFRISSKNSPVPVIELGSECNNWWMLCFPMSLFSKLCLSGMNSSNKI
jgi:hypothetical protein